MLAVCATPIGNLEDVTLRVLATLAAADLVLAEDTRHTRKLLSRHGVSAQLRSLHAHNERERVAEVLERLRRGETVALVSDAGMPAISDPGALLVASALAEGLPVSVLPGPSAVQAALVASGFAAERYLFIGFLPRRAAQLDALWAELDSWSWPTVAFEAPRRLPETLRSLAAALPERPLAVCRELTKTFEEVVRGSAVELSERFAEPPRGEITLVLGAAERASPGEGARAGEAHAAVAALVEAGTPRRTAVEVVAGLSGVGRNELYRASL